MGVRIGSAPPATAPSSELKDRASRLPTPGAASTSLEGTYGRELVHRIVAHLLHLLGSFGFVGPAKVTEGLDVMLADPDAMLGATFAAFDANGDGAIDATDLATTLSLARTRNSSPSSRRCCAAREARGGQRRGTGSSGATSTR